MGLSLEIPHTQFNHTRVGWVNEPNGRGTLSILVSCVSSLFLSSWAVMHLNVPKKNSSMAKHLATYFYWCIYGIFGPEMVIWAAWRQLLSALALRKQLARDNLINEQWTVSHGFYAAMGGFVIDLDTDPSSDLPYFTNGIRRLSVTPKGLLLLARCGHLPKISKADIIDKSKVDELGKLLACTQVTWMIVQVCTRLGMNLPVTTLEVTAVSHVTCALVLYALWWHKPRKVDEPTVITGDWIRPLAAFMLMCSRESQGQMLPGFTLTDEQSEMAGLKLFPREQSSHDYDFVQKHVVPNAKGCNETSSLHNPLDLPDQPHASSGSDQDHAAADAHHEIGTDRDTSSSGALAPSKTLERTEKATVVRWELAKEAIRKYPAVRQLLRSPPNESDRKYELALASYPEMPARCRRAYIPEEADATKQSWLECNTQHLVTIVADNWPHDGLLRPTSGLWIGISIWLASILYSGIHIAAWYASFPTIYEAWLWRAASIYIAFSGLLWAGLHAIAEYSARLWWAWYDVMSNDSPTWIMVTMYCVCGVCGVAYLLARAYIVVESFVSLRSLPVAAYVVPEWTLGVPHVA